ncbi:unnamed protein product [Musa textilis]
MSYKVMAACVQSCRTKSASIKPISSHLNGSLVAGPSLCQLMVDEVWCTIQEEARTDAEEEPFLRKQYYDLVLCHATLESALSAHLASKLAVPTVLPSCALQELVSSVLTKDPNIRRALRCDLRAAKGRDPACAKMVHCLLYYKGFQALQAHRVAHRLWTEGRRAMALLLQSRTSEVLAVDIHPGARIGAGVLLNHATGVVIGETTVVGDDVSILHGVTLGGTGKEGGDRHPKIGDGVLLGAGTKILGNVRIGEGTKIGAGSVVLKVVPPRTTTVGSPAALVNGEENRTGHIIDHTSCSNYAN